MTWQPQKIIKHRSTAAYNCHLSTRGSLFFSGFCLHQGLKASTSSCQAATWQAPNEALQSTSFTYWKIGLDSDPFIHDLKSKVVSLIPDVELHILQTFFRDYMYISYMIYISLVHFLLTKYMNTQEPYECKSVWIPFFFPTGVKRVFLSASISWVTLAVSSTFLACHPVGKYPIWVIPN